MLKGQFF